MFGHWQWNNDIYASANATVSDSAIANTLDDVIK